MLLLAVVLLSACRGEESKEYYTVSFNTETDGITVEDKTVLSGGSVSSPDLPYREGYRLLGWRIEGEASLFDFGTAIKKDMTLVAAWEKEAVGHIYDSHTPVYAIHDGSYGASVFANTAASLLFSLGFSEVGFGTSSETSENYHELVFGNTDREISKKAYRELENLTEGKEKIAYLIYSDGKSVAFAYTGVYNELALSLLTELAFSDYITDSLFLSPGVKESYAATVDEYYTELDEEQRREDWETLEFYVASKIGADGAASFVSALRELYSIYDESMVEWYARLYDPEYGGYYYSNSARDNSHVQYNGSYYELLPDIESTNQALNFLISSGMTSDYARDLPAFMKEQIVEFVRSCQDPNGYFYHPQWTKAMTDSRISRRSRDLIWAENILQRFGERPFYTTPGGMQGSLASSSASLTLPLSRDNISLCSYIVRASVVNSNLKDKASFTAYLNGLSIGSRSYHVGNELTAQTEEILERDRQLKKEGKDYQLMDILIAWLNENQDPATGCWQKSYTSDPYYATNGLLKISGIYNSAEVAMPNAKAAAASAIKAITLDAPLGAVVDLYNTWFTVDIIVKNIRKYGAFEDKLYANEMVGELLLAAPEAIRRSKEKISVFQKSDGSFSYTPSSSASTSQGMPVAIYGTNEGDVNATGISSTGLIGYMMNALELSSYKPLLFGKNDFRKYISIIEEKNREVQQEEYKKQPLDLSEYERIAFDGAQLPDRITANLVSGGAEAVIKNNALSYKTFAGGNDSLYITASGEEGYNAVIFNADISISDVSGGSTVFQVLCSDSDNTTAYMPVIGYEGGALTVSDASSTGDGSTRRVQLMRSGIAVDTVFNFGFEYYILGDGAVRIKLFIDGRLIYVSDNYYNSHKNASPATERIDRLRFYSLNAVNAAMTIDNVIFAKDTVEYVELSLGKK